MAKHAAAERMSSAPLTKLILGMSLPTMFSMLVNALYNIVDSIFVARLGEDALISVSLAYPVQTLLLAIGVGTGVGVNSLVARRLGEGKRAEAEQAALHGLLLSTLSWLIFALLGMFFSHAYIAMISSDPEIIEMGTAYTTVVTIASFGLLIGIAIEKVFQAAGRMMVPMLLQLVAALVNLVLDPILIFGWFGFPKMGVAGAAVATVLGQIVNFSVYIILVWRKKSPVAFHLRAFRFSGSIVRKIYAVGIPSIIMQALFSVVVTVFNAILIVFSQSAVSVLGVYFKMQTFIFMPILGLSQGIMPIMGYNYGAKKPQRIKKTIQISILLSVLTMVIGGLIFILFPTPLLDIFEATPNMLAIGIPALRIVSISFVFAAVDIVLSTFFQAIGLGSYSLVTSTLRQAVLLIPLAWILSKVNLTAIWFSFPISEILSLLICLILFVSVYRRYIRPLQSSSISKQID